LQRENIIETNETYCTGTKEYSTNEAQGKSKNKNSKQSRGRRIEPAYQQDQNFFSMREFDGMKLVK